MPLVAIVGRPNVGKSTLFNRLIRRQLAIVHREPGVTRDRLSSVCEWLGHRFTLIDTGGIGLGEEEPVGPLVRRQAEEAISAADLVLFVVDARQGVVPLDEEVAGLLRHSGRPVLLVANKVDLGEQSPLVHEFHRLGVGDPLPVSAAHGTGSGDLLDSIVQGLERIGVPGGTEAEEPERFRVAVVGRPNVGKSSLVNRLVGYERVITSESPGTTRDAVDVVYPGPPRPFILVDTAGLRRRTRVGRRGVERYGVVRALRAVDQCDVALLVFDAAEEPVRQDRHIAGYIHEAGKACIMVVNKVDLLGGAGGEPDEGALAEWEVRLRNNLYFVDYAPATFTSAVTGANLDHLPYLMAEVAAAHQFRAQTSLVNRCLLDAAAMSPAPAAGKRNLKLLYATQVAVRPPTFTLFFNLPELVTPPFLRFLESRLRHTFPLTGTPVRLLVRQRRRSGENED